MPTIPCTYLRTWLAPPMRQRKRLAPSPRGSVSCRPASLLPSTRATWRSPRSTCQGSIPKVDLSKVDIKKADPRNANLRQVELPKVDMAAVAGTALEFAAKQSVPTRIS